MPTLASRAAGSHTLFPDAWAQWQLLQPAATFMEMDGVEHMLPIEAPLDTAVVGGIGWGIGVILHKGSKQCARNTIIGKLPFLGLFFDRMASALD